MENTYSLKLGAKHILEKTADKDARKIPSVREFEDGAVGVLMNYVMTGNMFPVEAYSVRLAKIMASDEAKEKQYVRENTPVECGAVIRFASEMGSEESTRAVEGSRVICNAADIPESVLRNENNKGVFRKKVDALFEKMKSDTFRLVAVTLISSAILTGTLAHDMVLPDKAFGAGVSVSQTNPGKQIDLVKDIADILNVDIPGEKSKPAQKKTATEKLDMPVQYVSAINGLSMLEYFNENLLRNLLRESGIMGKYAFLENKIVGTLLDEICDEHQNKGRPIGYYSVKTNVALHAGNILESQGIETAHNFVQVLDILSKYCSKYGSTMKTSELVANFILLKRLSESSDAQKLVSNGIVSPSLVSQTDKAKKLMSEQIDVRITELEQSKGIDISQKLSSLNELKKLRGQTVSKAPSSVRDATGGKLGEILRDASEEGFGEMSRG